MAGEPDDVMLGLIREIRARQDRDSSKFVGFADELRGMRRDLAALGGEVTAIGREVSTLGGIGEGLRIDVDGLRGELGNLNVDFTEFRAEVSGMRVELDVVHSDSHDMRGEIHQVHGEVRELQVGMSEVRRVVVDHSLRPDFLDESFERIREGTVSATSFPAQASESNKQLKEELISLVKRVETLEWGQ